MRLRLAHDARLRHRPWRNTADLWSQGSAFHVIMYIIQIILYYYIMLDYYIILLYYVRLLYYITILYIYCMMHQTVNADCGYVCVSISIIFII